MIEGILHTEYNKSLREFPAMPLPTLDWNVGPPPNPFITEQRSWNRDTLEGTVQRCILLLNQEQLASYTIILRLFVKEGHPHSFSTVQLERVKHSYTTF